ncbi:MAG: hypothetical protein IJ795_08240 [Bacteroidales bacterium]|nr:hypothetical protein [Bacteroidales bacterium]
MRLRITIVLLLALLPGWILPAQSTNSEKVDSLVSLLSARSVELLERDGVSFRKVTGPARFFHNNTYLVCDTALWNMETEEIECMGNVKILQNETVLSSDKLIYLINEDLAQFRGTLVQLEDKDHNTLRTRYLDYNTKDSIAVFEQGGALRDKEGQIIESQTGTYESKVKLFTFLEDVNMFTDSIFVKTSKLEYDTRRNKAWFGKGTDAWKDDDMLSSDAGWYERDRELFLFWRNVHGMTVDKEIWSDSLYFWRNFMDVEMLGNVQLMDTVNHVSAVAGRMYYQDSISRVTMTRDPAVVGKTGDTGAPSDTVYVGADTLIYRTEMAFQIDSSRYKVARQRLANAMSDAVEAYRIKAAEEAKKAAEEAKKKDPNYIAKQQAEEAARKREERKNKGKAAVDSTAAGESPAPEALSQMADTLSAATDSIGVAIDSLGAVSDSLGVVRDSLGAARPDSLGVKIDSLVNRIDSLARDISGVAPAAPAQPDVTEPLDSAAQALKDSLDAVAAKFRADSIARADSIQKAIRDSIIADSIARMPKDSTRFGFLTALRNVRLFREDMQMRCDSLEYCDLDSLIRLYKEPIVWNEKRRQYVADSLHIVPREGKIDRAYLISNAFIIIQEDSLCFDQIRSAEMLAFFDSTTALRRFDALGDASAVFYLQEDSVFATVNKSEARMLSTEFKDGDIDILYYYDNPKTDAHPLAQMKKEDRVLKGFNWQPDLRPRRKEDITSWKARMSERSTYSSRPRASFRQTDIYFPGYMAGVYKDMKDKEIRRQQRERARKAREEFLKDSTARALRDSLVADSLKVIADSLFRLDSLKAVQDSLKAVQDSLKAVQDSVSAVVRDSLSRLPKDSSGVAGAVVLSKAEIQAAEKARKEKERAERKKARQEARAAKEAAREAEWARLDSLDAVKDSLAKEKAQQKIRDRKLKQIERARKQELRDAQKLEKYRRRFERQKARKLAREAAKAARKARSEALKSKPVVPEPDLPESLKSRAKEIPEAEAVRDTLEGEAVIQP